MKHVAAFMLVGVLAGCAGLQTGERQTASAELQPTRGNQANGTVTFTQKRDAVQVMAHVQGLKPSSQHGFHVHEKGDCSAPDGASAGGHFNPTGRQHGHPEKGPHHLGDMPNLKADGTGHAVLTYQIDGATLGKGPTSLVGRGVIVHGGTDDYASQPAGDAGPRIACGVITKS